MFDWPAQSQISPTRMSSSLTEPWVVRAVRVLGLKDACIAGNLAHHDPSASAVVEARVSPNVTTTLSPGVARPDTGSARRAGNTMDD